MTRIHFVPTAYPVSSDLSPVCRLAAAAPQSMSALQESADQVALLDNRLVHRTRRFRKSRAGLVASRGAHRDLPEAKAQGSGAGVDPTRWTELQPRRAGLLG